MNEENEERFAFRLCKRLNGGLDTLAPTNLRRLEAARHFALSHRKQEISSLAMAKRADRGVSVLCFYGEGNVFRQIFAVALLVFAVMCAVYWQGQQYVQDLEDVDSALLSDDLPPHAFLDKDFAEWLDDSSEE